MILKIFNNKALRIALDIDDTLVSFNEQFFNTFPFINPNDSHAITKQVWALRHSGDFWENLNLLERPVGFEPTIYATKRVNSKQFTRTNLVKLGLPIKPIYQTYTQSGNKVDKIKGHCDLLIDDSIYNVKQALMVGFPAICISRPHNLYDTSVPRIDRLHIEDIIDVYNRIVISLL